MLGFSINFFLFEKKSKLWFKKKLFCIFIIILEKLILLVFVFLVGGFVLCICRIEFYGEIFIF